MREKHRRGASSWLWPLLVAALGGCRVSGERVDIEAQPALVRSEHIFALPDRPTPGCHASTIVESDDGTLVAAWFGGEDEGESDVGIWVSRRGPDGWSPPVEVADGAMSPQRRFPCWNPVLFRPRPGLLVLFYKVGRRPDEWWGEMKISRDGGLTWTGHRRLPSHVMGPIKNKPVMLEDGRILCPSSSEHDGWKAHLEITRDLRTWEVVGPVPDPDGYGVIQPTILVHPEGRLQMLLRSSSGGRIAQTWSDDGGASWSPLTATPLRNPDAGIDAITLEDGRHLVVYNDSQIQRSPLRVAISDDGLAWWNVLTLADGPGEYSYPAVIQSADGLVHVTFTWWRQGIRYATIDPTKL